MLFFPFKGHNNRLPFDVIATWQLTKRGRTDALATMEQLQKTFPQLVFHLRRASDNGAYVKRPLWFVIIAFDPRTRGKAAIADLRQLGPYATKGKRFVFLSDSQVSGRTAARMAMASEPPDADVVPVPLTPEKLSELGWHKRAVELKRETQYQKNRAKKKKQKCAALDQPDKAWLADIRAKLTKI